MYIRCTRKAIQSVYHVCDAYSAADVHQQCLNHQKSEIALFTFFNICLVLLLLYYSEDHVECTDVGIWIV